MSKQKSNADKLLAAIQRTALTAAPEPAEAPVESKKPASSGGKAVKKTAAAKSVEPIRSPVGGNGAPGSKPRVGKPVQFWLHEEDRRLVRELSAWLAGQGERPTDSLVIRSALRIAQANGDFLNAYRQASQLDGRLKHHKIA